MTVAITAMAVAALTFLYAALILRLRKNRAAVSGRLERLAPEREKRAALRRLTGESPGGGLLGKLASGGGRKRMEKLGDELYISGIAMRPEEFLMVWVFMGLVIPCFMMIMETKLMAVIGLLIIGCAAPIGIVKFSKARCMKQFDAQLLDAMTVICNSLRAGFSFQTALDNVSGEMPDPISREFRRASQECHYGMTLEESLNRLVQRTGNRDLEMIVSAVIIQKQIGGNLAEVLESISGTIRDRITQRGELKAMTASGTMSGYIIGLMPIVLLVLMMVLNPSHVEVFFNTRTGNLLLALAALMETVGFIFVRRIVSVKL